MSKACASLVLVLVLTVLGTAQNTKAKPLGVAPEQVQRVEILYFPEHVLVRAAFTPQRLEQLYKYKLEIRDAGDSPQWKRLVPNLHKTVLSPSTRSHDHRTAVLLFDKNGQRIASVYFDQFGTGGTINGESGGIDGSMYDWAKGLLKGVAE
jgi:hypothetical protein